MKEFFAAILGTAILAASIAFMLLVGWALDFLIVWLFELFG